MSSTISRAAGVIAIVIAATACLRGNGEGYFARPSDGARWEYKLDYITSLAGVQSGKLLVRVDGTETIGDHTYFKHVYVYSGIPGAEPDVRFYRWSSDGIFEVDGRHKNQPEHLEIPFPVEVGSTWIAEGPERRTQYRVQGIETLELFDRSYEDCLQIAYTVDKGSTRVEGTMYLVKGIGLVKETWSAGGVTYEVTLETFDR